MVDISEFHLEPLTESEANQGLSPVLGFEPVKTRRRSASEIWDRTRCAENQDAAPNTAQAPNSFHSRGSDPFAAA
jgi:hypothetical protein